jgi:hypothetical protein
MQPTKGEKVCRIADDEARDADLPLPEAADRRLGMLRQRQCCALVVAELHHILWAKGARVPASDVCNADADGRSSEVAPCLAFLAARLVAFFPTSQQLFSVKLCRVTNQEGVLPFPYGWGSLPVSHCCTRQLGLAGICAAALSEKERTAAHRPQVDEDAANLRMREADGDTH